LKWLGGRAASVRDRCAAGVAGLEVRVAFKGLWKESLSELSGGQKSLLALSLILAMLLFKPAPIYILDEVRARAPAAEANQPNVRFKEARDNTNNTPESSSDHSPPHGSHKYRLLSTPSTGSCV